MKRDNERARAQTLIKRFCGTPILVVGDLMLDRFVWGNVTRISPEAPVPVLETVRESWAPGGSGNVVANLRAMGAAVFTACVVGDDPEGRMLVGEFEAKGIDVQGIVVDAGRPTSRKTRIIAQNQQVIRMDVEKTHEIDHQINDRLIEYVRRVVPRCRAIIISDYGKGVVTRKLLKAVISCARKHRRPVIVDPKIEHFRQYKGITCITPNMHEAHTGMGRFMKKETPEAIDSLGKDILKRLKCASVLITNGEKGMNLFRKGRPAVHIPVAAREVFDVTGAGDTVISVLSLAIGCGADLVTAAKISNHAAGFVVSKVGTVSITRADLARAIRTAERF